MIKEIKLKFGRAPGGDPITITPTPITVFVGPNNSGKSRALSEIDAISSNGPQSNNLIIEKLDFDAVEENQISLFIERLKVKPAPNEIVSAGNMIIGSRKGRLQLPTDQLTMHLKHPEANPHAYAQWFLNHLVLKLDGQSRIGLINPQPAGDLQQPGHSSLQVLFRENSKRDEVRRIIKDAFGSYFVIDPTNIGSFRIRLSHRPPADETEERGLHEAAVAFHAAAQPIEQASDGVKAFVGIVTEFIAGDPKVLLIDEPEAFLHPALAFSLGLEISRSSINSDKKYLYQHIVLHS